MNKPEVLRFTARKFAGEANKLPSVLEIAIVGSVAGGDPYPNDLDLALIIRDFKEIATLAKYARRMSKYYNDWEVFLFDENLSPLNRICHRKKCPGQSIDCSVPGCGEPRFIRILPEFEYNERLFLTSPMDILYTSFEPSLFLWHKETVGIVESRKYAVLEDIELDCINCGNTFIFTGGERKWYQKRGLDQPRTLPRLPGAGTLGRVTGLVVKPVTLPIY